MSDTDLIIRPGKEVTLDDRALTIGQIGASVTLLDGFGNVVETAPLPDVVAAMQTDDGPPAFLEVLQFEEKLTPHQRERLDDFLNVLSIMETGLPRGASKNQPIPERYDPARRAWGKRLRALAKDRAKTYRTSGAAKNRAVKKKSELRALQRAFKRYREGGIVAVVDPRPIRTRGSRAPGAIWDEMESIMSEDIGRSTVSDLEYIRRLCTNHKVAAPGQGGVPSLATMRRMCASIRKRNNDTMHGIAPTRRSAGNVPEPSEVLRAATRPGELVLFDTSVVNVMLDHPAFKKAIRVEYTLALDLYSRSFCGLSVTINTSGQGVALCLADVLRPKAKEEIRDWTEPWDHLRPQPYVGIPALWGHVPAFVPEDLVTDNGSIYTNAYFVQQLANMQISYEPQRTYTPTDKAQVERAFRTIKDQFEAGLAGFLGGGVQERGAHPELEELLTVDMYERRLRQYMDLHNNTPIEGLYFPPNDDKLHRDRTPFEMWEHWTQKGTIRVPKANAQWVRMMPHMSVTVTSWGVKFRRLKYGNPAKLHELLRDPRIAEGRKINIFHNPSDLRSVWLIDGDGKPHELHWRLRRHDTERFGEAIRGKVISSLTHRNFTEEEFLDRLTSMRADWRREELGHVALKPGRKARKPAPTTRAKVKQPGPAKRASGPDHAELKRLAAEDLLEQQRDRMRTLDPAPITPLPPEPAPGPAAKKDNATPRSQRHRGLETYGPGSSLWR